MALVKTKKKFATELVVSVDSFVTSGLAGHGPFPVAAGARFRRDHPVVAICSDFFCDDGTPLDEIQGQRTALYMAAAEPPQPPAPTAREERRLKDEDAVVNVFNGDRAHKRSAEAKRRPDWFVDIVPPGLERGDALIARSSMRLIDEGGRQTRVVHAGQWVDRDDPLVELHPHNWAMPDAVEPARAPKASSRTEA